MAEQSSINTQFEQNKQEQPMSQMMKILIIGVFGGLFWGFMGYLSYYLNFSKIGPALVLNPIALGDWKNELLGQIIGIFLIGLISIIPALLFYAFLKKSNKFWSGFIFGAVLWGVVFYLLNPIFPGLDKLTKVDANTIITTVCLYVLYGVFIGYSITYEVSEMNRIKDKYSKG